MIQERNVENEKSIEEFEKDPAHYAKRSCNKCYGRGIEGQALTNPHWEEGKTEKQYTRTPVYCTCALTRFTKSAFQRDMAEREASQEFKTEYEQAQTEG